jgi:hypothetical protein
MAATADWHQIGPAVAASELASTSAGLGASLIGYQGGTTVQAAVAAVIAESAASTAGALQKRTVTVGHATLTDAVAGEAQAINIGAVLPANAVVIAREVALATPFSGGGVSSCLLDVGGTDVDAIVNALELITDAPTESEVNAAGGIKPQGGYSAQQLVATFTPDGGHTLADLTAGSVVITVWFHVLA